MEEIQPEAVAAPAGKARKEVIPFTGYQQFIILILALLQFTIILDFMIISPLGDILLKNAWAEHIPIWIRGLGIRH